MPCWLLCFAAGPCAVTACCVDGMTASAKVEVVAAALAVDVMMSRQITYVWLNW
jgi:hypothetical protein